MFISELLQFVELPVFHGIDSRKGCFTFFYPLLILFLFNFCLLLILHRILFLCMILWYAKAEILFAKVYGSWHDVCGYDVQQICWLFCWDNECITYNLGYILGQVSVADHNIDQSSPSDGKLVHRNKYNKCQK